MKRIILRQKGLLLLFLSSPLIAQQTPTQSSTLADGGAQGLDAASANNPASTITQIQIQSWYHPSYDGQQGQGDDFILRPILPFNAKGIVPSSIIRPALDIESTPNGRTGLGDLQVIVVVFPGWQPASHFKIGVGPVAVAPTATNRYAGQGQWQVGPTALIIYTGVKRLVLGAIADNPISVGGEHGRAGVNALTLEPLVVKTFKDSYFVRFDPYGSFDWQHAGTAVLPLNLGFGRLLHVRGQLVNAYIQPEGLVTSASYGNVHPPRFTLRFAAALLYAHKPHS